MSSPLDDSAVPDWQEGLVSIKPAIWRVQLDAGSPNVTLQCSGKGVSVEREQAGSEVYLTLPHIRHRLLTVTPGRTALRTLAGNKVPVYARSTGSRIRLSNAVYPLLERGEEVALSTTVLVQQLRGANFPQDSLFLDIPLLEASSGYVVADGQVKYERTTLMPIRNARREEALERLVGAFDDLSCSGLPISILLSGGYDSRLNLALALRCAKKHGNPLWAYHEFKDQTEYELAKAVAQRAGVGFTSRSRSAFLSEAPEMMSEPGFVLSSSGAYRHNLLRWHGYLRWIQSQRPNGTIIGFGAEAHKGKYYRKIRNLRPDSERLLGMSNRNVESVAQSLGIRHYDRSNQKRFFADLCEHAQVYPSLDSRVDFVHYQTYVSNGYGKRCHDLLQYFSIPFPFLDDTFLQTVFSLRREEKEGFAFVTYAIGELFPQLLEIPFTSANAKSLEPFHTIAWNAFLSRSRTLARGFGRKTTHRLRNGSGSATLIPWDCGRLRAYKPNSQITDRLRGIILGDHGRIPGIRLQYVLELFLYLAELEKRLSIAFRCT